MSKMPAMTLTILSAALWGVSIASAFTPMVPDRADLLIVAGAAMTGIIAALLWVARGTRIHNGSLGLLARTVADVTRPADVHAGLRRVQ
jgi:hypothetical protein